MENGKRKTFISQQAAAQVTRQQEEGVPPTRGTIPIKPFIKRKMMDKVDHSAKKSKVVISPTVRETAQFANLPLSLRHGTGKGLMTAKGLVVEQRPPLLREDSRYAIEQLLSIIKDDGYKDLGNHATEAMGETGLFCLGQVCNCPLSLPSLSYPYF